jgi:HlyD family type I secretion membrane fusion protein
MSVAELDLERPISDDPAIDGRIGWIVAAVFFLGILGVSAFARVDAAVFATGKIEVLGNRQSVQHPDGGVIAALNVKEGDRVKAGDVLISLGAPQVQAEARALASRVIGLEALKVRLEAEQSGSAIRAPADFAGLTGEDASEAADTLARQAQELQVRRAAITNQKAVYAAQKGQLNEQIAGAQKQADANQEQQGLLGETMASYRILEAKGLASANQLRDMERTRSALQGSAGDLQAQMARAREAIGQVELQSVGLDKTRAQEVEQLLRETQANLSDAAPRWEAARRRMASTEVRAPATGQVVGLSIFTVGGVVTPGQVLMEIVPDSAALTVVAQVKPEDADSVRVGQKTEVRFSGLRQRNLPKVTGSVVRMSADSFADQRTGARFFRAEIEVPPQEWRKLAAIDGVGELRPGLPAQIVILLRKRTVLEYLFEPMEQRLWRSFREG